MPTGMTVYFSGSKFARTENADCSDTSYSVEHPPKMTAIVFFCMNIILSATENKNTLMLLDVISKIEDKNVKYLICGEGPLQKEYEKKIEKYGLSQRVKLLGFRRDIPQILNSADLYIKVLWESLSQRKKPAHVLTMTDITPKAAANSTATPVNDSVYLLTKWLMQNMKKELAEEAGIDNKYIGYVDIDLNLIPSKFLIIIDKSPSIMIFVNFSKCLISSSALLKFVWNGSSSFSTIIVISLTSGLFTNIILT